MIGVEPWMMSYVEEISNLQGNQHVEKMGKGGKEID